MSDLELLAALLSSDFEEVELALLSDDFSDSDVAALVVVAFSLVEESAKLGVAIDAIYRERISSRLLFMIHTSII